MNIKPVVISCVLLYSPVMMAAEDNRCPPELVKFWTSVAHRMQNADAIPRFLLNNRCLAMRGATNFSDLTAQRLDEPERAELVDQMVAQLHWANPASLKR